MILFQRKTPNPNVDLSSKPRKKSNFDYLASYTSLRIHVTNSWYFDSGCSRHMIDSKSILNNYKPVSERISDF